ncbi:hypothetical protein KSP40_PGU007890 [Platanthera guangdongensis]|uniref:proline--tRNA ligase n=1 Tax=Platanthera guangdongensis TaxID=2320717 RepID=A0ABR2MZL4_9ASPA
MTDGALLWGIGFDWLKDVVLLIGGRRRRLSAASRAWLRPWQSTTGPWLAAAEVVDAVESLDWWLGAETVLAKVAPHRAVRDHVAASASDLARTHLKDVHVIFNLEMIDCEQIPWLYTAQPWITIFDAEIKKMGIKEAYFHMFLTERIIQKEKYHIECFAPKIADRPRSETAVYPYFSKWISSHEDLPLKLNQWCNIIEWKYKPHYPFIRNPEFLWQEGHSAFATKEEADVEVANVLSFPEGKCSRDIGIISEILRRISCHSSGERMEKLWNKLCHFNCLGQSFAQKFEIYFENEEGKNDMVWKNFWTYSTVTIGVMMMVHGDDKGLVLPPKVADLQIIIIHVPDKDADDAIYEACSSAVYTLLVAGFRAEHDFRDYSLGWKYSCWEMKGIPLIIEIGPEDIAKNQVQIIRRDNGSKIDVPIANLVEHVRDLLSNIHESMFNAAKVKRDACKKIIYTWEEFMSALNEKKLILAPWCDEEEFHIFSFHRKLQLTPLVTHSSPPPKLSSGGYLFPHQQSTKGILM